MTTQLKCLIHVGRLIRDIIWIALDPNKLGFSTLTAKFRVLFSIKIRERQTTHSTALKQMQKILLSD